MDFSQQERNLVHLDEAAVRHLLPPEEAVRAVRDAYVALDRGTVEAPLRAALPARDGLATTLVMPSRGRAGAAGSR
ncbi:MAG: hypothetical protein IRZ18_09925, partial [Clostridia bacterium]|nr:hypothetical protein [Clostridia bacterium]